MQYSINNVFKIYFFLFAVVFGAMYGMQENKSTCYKRLIHNQPFRMLTSAVIGGLSTMGLKYSINNNKFLSLRLPEKIKDAPYWQFFAPGMIFGGGLYEWVNHRFMKRQKKAPRPESKEQDKIVEKIMKIAYVCPGSLYSLLKPTDGLKTETAKRIGVIMGNQNIMKNNTVQFFATSSYSHTSMCKAYLRDTSYAAALYLINEDQKKDFEEKFARNVSNGDSNLLYDLYDIKPTSTENLCCYALPLETLPDSLRGFNISTHVIPKNIQEYAFQLPEEDAKKINLNAPEIIGVDLIKNFNK